MIDLKEMHDKTCRRAKAIMEEKQGMQSFFVVHILDDSHSIMTQWQSQMEKQVYLAAMRVMFREPVVEAYSFVTEAWLAHVNMRTQPELMEVQPKDRSDRDDTLIILTRNREGESYETKYLVTYDIAGRVVLGPAEHGSWDHGLIGNLFEDPT